MIMRLDCDMIMRLDCDMIMRLNCDMIMRLDCDMTINALHLFYPLYISYLLWIMQK